MAVVYGINRFGDSLMFKVGQNFVESVVKEKRNDGSKKKISDSGNDNILITFPCIINLENIN